MEGNERPWLKPAGDDSSALTVQDLYYFMLPDGSDSQGSGYSSLLGTAEAGNKVGDEFNLSIFRPYFAPCKVWSPSPAPLPQLSKRSQKHWGVLEPEPGNPHMYSSRRSHCKPQIHEGPLQPRLHPEILGFLGSTSPILLSTCDLPRGPGLRCWIWRMS